MAENEPTNELDTETLRGDIRDEVLREFKHMPKSWQTMTEDEQQRIINRAADVADKLVRRAVDLVAARGLPALPIEVGKFTVDGAAIKGTFECYADDESLLRIKHLANKRAMFVLASPDAYNGEKAKPETEVVGDLAIPKEAATAQAEENLAKVGRGKSKANGAAEVGASA
jgi:hypothetical protein